ncbi:FAD-binding oxidoreductase [Solicola gregarius]|uniref:FAD-binding oxidoreductase n=1 Tax=Solicola gregarius TaxID=2908642 RepID=A0AA46TLR0_9ACTN|nr:FAD-binding oxidoreductase [Solicola gregarius]UYM07644.1 FAD-binding oxidoreductase [Solicola gregarius]
MTATESPAALALRDLPRECVHLPGDETYDAARTPWNLAVDQRPAAVVVPRSPAEVATAVRLAARADLRVAAQSTGHGAGALAAQALDDVVIVRTHALDKAVADPARGVVRAEGGALWDPAVTAAAAYDRAVLHGSSPDVGVAGYSLGGGIGWYAREHGLATNSLTAVELVLADGTPVRTDATHDPELFWALRGGGGNLGVVTALEFRMYDIATAYAGILMWDLADVEPVLREWAAWAPSAPDEITTSFRAMRLPDLPDIPEFLRGRRIAIVDGAVLGSDEYGSELLAGLRALRPELDTFARVPAASLVRLHMDPEGALPFVSDSTMLQALPDAALNAYLEHVGPDADSSLLMGELRQLGGALSRPDPGGVLSHLDAQFLAFGVALAPTPELGAAGLRDASALVSALTPYSGGRQYLNFCERPVDLRTAYHDDVWRRLVDVRSAVDPHRVLLANHPLPRPEESGAPAT